MRDCVGVRRWKEASARVRCLTQMLAITKMTGRLWRDITTPATFKSNSRQTGHLVQQLHTRTEPWTLSLDQTASCVRQQNGSREDAHITGISPYTTDANLRARPNSYASGLNFINLVARAWTSFPALTSAFLNHSAQQNALDVDTLPLPGACHAVEKSATCASSE